MDWNNGKHHKWALGGILAGSALAFLPYTSLAGANKALELQTDVLTEAVCSNPNAKAHLKTSTKNPIDSKLTDEQFQQATGFILDKCK